jgi:peptide/nickel transport system substrate-binding protein
MNRMVSWMLLSTLALAACAAPPSPGGQTGQSQSSAPAAPKSIVMANNEDPRNFWDGVNGGGGSGSREIGHLVNQYLANLLPDGQVVPRLLAELPAVDKGTWNVSPDGKMEVTYKIRPGVTWHDGMPFTAEDIAFSAAVGKDPLVPNGNQSALRLVDSVTVVDPLTAVMNYKETYAFADRLEHREFFPLPKHVLATPYADNKETLISQPYFTDEYVGVGPYKLVSWEHGSHMDLIANDNYFLGRPKIDRMRIQFISDANTGVANLQAGSINTFLSPGGPDWDQVQPLRAEWQATGKGEILIERVRWQFVEPQKGPLASPTDLKDARVRQALLMAMNREELTRSLQGEFGQVAHSWVYTGFSYYDQVKDVITEYPYDVRRATAMLAEAGWTPGPDGILQKGGQKFTIQVRPQEAMEKQATIVQQDWKAIGLDAQLEVLSNVLLRDPEARANFSGAALNGNPMGGASAVRRFASDQVPTAGNRYAGTNRGQFSNAAWDEAGAGLRTALDDNRRLQLERDMLRVFSAELPALPYQYELQGIPVTGFKGYFPVTGTAHTGNIMHTTNVHEWDLTCPSSVKAVVGQE